MLTAILDKTLVFPINGLVRDSEYDEEDGHRNRSGGNDVEPPTQPNPPDIVSVQRVALFLDQSSNY